MQVLQQISLGAHMKNYENNYGFRFMWRLMYAGRTLETTMQPFAVCWRQANEAWQLYGPNARETDPKALADKRNRMYGLIKREGRL